MARRDTGALERVRCGVPTSSMWSCICALAWLATGCGGGDGRTLTVEQYEEVAVPGVDGATLTVGDIADGSVAAISVTLGGAVIAKGNLRRGDELPFVIRRDGGKTQAHVLTVDGYRDHLVGDEAMLRINDRRPTSKDVVLLAVGTLAMPSTPDIKLTLAELAPPRVRLGVTTPTSNADPRILDLGEPLTFELHGTPYFLEALSFDGPAVYVRVAPRRR
jgi:hypothetical protein